MPLPRPPEEEPSLLESLSQMGLAMYAFLVLGMMGCSGLCMGMTVYGIMSSADDISGLRAGSELEIFRVAQLQQWGVLHEGDAPLLYHDHSSFFDGTSGCVVAGDTLSRWDQQALTGRVDIPGASVSALGEEDAPTVRVERDGAQVECPFDAGEGGERFLRMLKTEASRQPPAPQ
ncbi:MAG: hypothetical protein H6741_16495 [Alphaproteobacteria bacterium]|nr:hypothetical protein [Alphaproteobacteria bacterium]MCB9794315.1 hypothetical protein [Alphaproteobacteria bacterium]